MMTSIAKRHQLRWSDSACVAFLVLCSAATIGPVLWHWNDWLYGIGGDGFGAPAGIAALDQASDQGNAFGRMPLLMGAPFASSNLASAADPLWWHAGALLTIAFSAVGATNALIFVGLVGSAVTAYGLLRRCRLCSSAALVGALVYGFCPIRLAEAQEHFLLLDGFWFVIEGGLLLLIAWRRKMRWAVALGLCVAFADLDNPYLGYFAGVLAGSWFVMRGILQRYFRDGHSLRVLAVQSVVVLVVLLAVVIPTQWPLLAASGGSSRFIAGGAPFSRSLGDLDRLSLRWWNFFLPPPDNPIFGRVGRATFYAHLGVDTVSEQSTMVGYVALVLAVVGALFALRRRSNCSSAGTAVAVLSPEVRTGLDVAGRRGALGESSRYRSLATLALICIGSGIFFGLPPEFRFGPVLVPTAPHFVHAVLPQIRTTSRIDLLIQLGVAILAALGASMVLSKVRSPGRRHLLAGALVLAVLLEYTNVPPWRYVKLLPSPPVYQWLASLTPTQAGIVVQYPIEAADLARTPLYAFYAYDVHHHPLFNGVLPDTPPDALRRNLLDMLNPTNPASWAALGIKTLTVDTTYYDEYFHNAHLDWSVGPNGFEKQLPVGLSLRHVDPAAQGYAISTKPALVVAGLGAGFGSAVLEHDGRDWSWIARQATIWLDNVTSSPVQAVLWTSVHNNRSGHMLTWPGVTAVPVSADQQASTIAIVVTAAPGFHSLPINASGAQQPLPGDASSGPASVELRSLEPAKLQTVEAGFTQGDMVSWRLTGFSMDACTIQAGNTLNVALLWSVEAPTTDPETVFLHLLNSAGAIVAQGDGDPEGGTVNTQAAAVGTRLSDVHSVVLPKTLPAGVYQLEAGLYNRQSMMRMPVLNGTDQVPVGKVTVIAPTPGPASVPCGW